MSAEQRLAGTPESLHEIEMLLDRLWPILRSITGEGVRETLAILSEVVPLQRIEVPSATKVFDWTVPPEWVVREAYVLTPSGERILDVRENNLHLLNFSAPFRGTLSRAQLEEHLYSLPDQPHAIPYITSYYERRWGLCISQHQREALPEGDYEVVIDTEHIEGSLSIGEAVLPGEGEGEVLISTYTCHPSLANNELSGPLVAAFLYRRLSRWPVRRLTYRFVFAPETIGAIAYLSLRGEHLCKHLLAGYVVTCVGIEDRFTLKRSRRGDTLADRAALYVLSRLSPAPKVIDFFPSGSDERQYCSPGFNLPVASVMRTMYGCYPEYHTSLDDRDLISCAALRGSVDVYERILHSLDTNRLYLSQAPFCEPQLSPRGLYGTLGTRDSAAFTDALLWLLNFADGEHDLLEVAHMSGIDIDELAAAARACAGAGLVSEVTPREVTPRAAADQPRTRPCQMAAHSAPGAD
jgi:aminopeptidase-like protein